MFLPFQNFGLKLNLDGTIRSAVIKGQESSFTQDFAYYIGAYGNNREFENRSSGAYIFRNNGSAVDVLLKSSTVYNGKQTLQTFSLNLQIISGQ